jgi:predicted restriction endonuclease
MVQLHIPKCAAECFGIEKPLKRLMKTFTLDASFSRSPFSWMMLSGFLLPNGIKTSFGANHFIDLEREARRIEEEKQRYGKESVIRPRLGQGAFRVLVTDAYHRSCAISGEHSLPALEAAHIKPYIDDGPHSVNNGLLLRSDIHRLFDAFYITVTPEFRIEVSRRLKEEFENGRSYYPFHGKSLTQLPTNREDMPFLEFLEWHNNNFGS